MNTKLVIASGKSAGKAVAMKQGRLLIGRAEECDVRPLSDEVSRRHCLVRLEPDTVWVEDLGSRNGTFVNGVRITEKTKLFDGDLIKVGALQLQVSDGPVPPPAAKAAAAVPSSWQDEEEVSRWLLAESGQPSGMHDTTQTAAAVQLAEDVSAPAAGEGQTIHAGPPSAEGSSVARMSIDEIRASRANPSGLPAEAKKTAASSREAAAEALKKLFNSR